MECSAESVNRNSWSSDGPRIAVYKVKNINKSFRKVISVVSVKNIFSTTRFSNLPHITYFVRTLPNAKGNLPRLD